MTEKQKTKYKERGITLIALVITIIVLLILAGVTLSALTGDSGILKNAEKAKEETGIANEKEIIQLAISEAIIDAKTGENTYQDIQEALDDILKNEKATSMNNGDTIVVKFEKSERYYKIDENGNVEIFTPYFDTTPGLLAKNSDSKYMIESIEDLVVFSAMVNGGYSDENIDIICGNWINAVLMCDLDFKSPLSYSNSETTLYNGYLGVEDKNVTLIESLTNIDKYKGFIPIGKEGSVFRGSFDGKDHYIRNLCENSDSNAGLFGRVEGVTIQNINVTGNIKSTSYAGGIVGWNNNDHGTKSIISNCTNYANVYGNYAGGIAGQNTSQTGGGNGTTIISSCANYGNIVGNTYAGGIVGKQYNVTLDIKDCVNFGKVLGEESGGMLGYGNAYIYSCCSMPSSVVSTFEGKGNAGGMVGELHTYANIYNSINLGTVTAGVNARTVLLEPTIIIMSP